MKTKRGWITMVIFLALIGFGGIGLAATGNLDNPLSFLSTGGAPAGSGEPRSAPPTMSSTDANAGTMPARGGGESASIDWSQSGSVLFNVWFLGATAAVVMLIGLSMAFVRKRARRKTPTSRTVLPGQA